MINGPEIEMEYQYDKEKNTVLAIMHSNEEMAETKPTWNLSDDKKTYTKEYDDNENYVTSVKDIWRNETNVHIKIDKIDKVYPFDKFEGVIIA